MEKSTFVRYTTPEEKKAAFMRSVNLRKECDIDPSPITTDYKPFYRRNQKIR